MTAARLLALLFGPPTDAPMARLLILDEEAFDCLVRSARRADGGDEKNRRTACSTGVPA
ncbi:hypothetical protein [Streptomyces sp. NPDC055912]|uniref:hypothetical protein n=1 Tax=Streptomyces sp. NPDC055912 TaxID=3345660 RepID=UPI0035DDFEFD